MMNIEQEAEEYTNNWEKITGLDSENTSPLECSKIDFIAGHNSKATQVKMLQAQIDVLKELDEEKTNGTEHDAYYELIDMKKQKINQLQQQLKELE